MNKNLKICKIVKKLLKFKKILRKCKKIFIKIKINYNNLRFFLENSTKFYFVLLKPHDKNFINLKREI